MILAQLLIAGFIAAWFGALIRNLVWGAA